MDWQGARHVTARAAIMNAAERVFSNCGIRATSMRRIADELGVGRAALYYYFPSKDALVLATMASVADRFGSLDPPPECASFAEAIEHTVVETVAQLCASRDGLRFLWTVVIEQLQEELDIQPVTGLIDQFHQRIFDIVARAQRAGEVDRQADPAHAADSMTAGVIGAQGMWLLDANFDLAGAAHRLACDFVQRWSTTR
jgi:AcrR family transcriptional regulator